YCLKIVNERSPARKCAGAVSGSKQKGKKCGLNEYADGSANCSQEKYSCRTRNAGSNLSIRSTSSLNRNHSSRRQVMGRYFANRPNAPSISSARRPSKAVPTSISDCPVYRQSRMCQQASRNLSSDLPEFQAKDSI